MEIYTYFLYCFLFIVLYLQIFLLFSLFKKSDKKIDKKDIKNLTATILVPCWNEENTVKKTINSLLEMDYPKDKFSIIIIDDGSTDNTWNVLQEFKDNPQVILIQKENEGSKHYALNYAMKFVDTDLVGCLDADSRVSKNSLNIYMKYFADQEIMAVIPSMVIDNPKNNILRLAQKAEYEVGLFARKAFHNLNALYIAPGPLSVFRRKVFEEIGLYKKAHLTEDCEIALRMQLNGYKIAYAEEAIVYTVGPDSIRDLYRQRKRWNYGFIKNALDYKKMFFNSKFRHLGVSILPLALFRLFAAVLLLPITIWKIINPIITKAEEISIVGLNFDFTFDWFFVNFDTLVFFSLLSFLILIVTVLIGRYILNRKIRLSFDIIWMILMYMFIAPVWIITSTFNSLISKEGEW